MTRQSKQGPDLRDLWRSLEGVIFGELWLNEVQSKFFEAVLAFIWPRRLNMTLPLAFSWPVTPLSLCQLSGVNIGALAFFFNFLRKKERKKERKKKKEEENLRLLELRLQSRR